MHEKILQGVTVGIVAGLAVYWLTSKHGAGDEQSTQPQDYKPLLGDVRAIRFGTPSTFCDDEALTQGTQNSPALLAADYLCGAPEYAPPVSKWNLGISLQLSCEGIDLHSCINRRETATSFPFGECIAPNTTPKPIRISQQFSCSPDVPLPVDCTGVI